MAMAATSQHKDPSYMSYILKRVFASCELYRELQIRYIFHDEVFQNILTAYELEQLNLDIKTNIDKLEQLRSIAAQRWTFDDFTEFLKVLGKNGFEPIEKAMQTEHKKQCFLKPCLPVPEILQPRSVPSRVIPAPRHEAPWYTTLDKEMQTYPKVLIPRTYPQQETMQRDRSYDMRTSPRGMALVISNEKFTHLSLRQGNQKDKESLAKLFAFLGYKVAFTNNRTALEMNHDLQCFARDKRLGNVSAIIIVILTHGMSEGVLFGKDGRVVNTDRGCEPKEGTYITKDDLQNLLNSTACPLMLNKPKGFILQACRGVDEDNLQSAETTSSLQSENPIGKQTKLLHKESSEKQVSKTGDFLFAYPSTSGFKAYRQPTIGSPFIKRLCDLIITRGHEDHFEDILKELRRSFKYQLAKGVCMMPEVSGTLLYDWYFNPPK